MVDPLDIDDRQNRDMVGLRVGIRSRHIPQVSCSSSFLRAVDKEALGTDITGETNCLCILVQTVLIS